LHGGEPLVVDAMEGNFVSGVHDRPDPLWIALGSLDENEERSGGLVAGEHIKDRRRPAAGPVVECERYGVEDLGATQRPNWADPPIGRASHRPAAFRRQRSPYTPAQRRHDRSARAIRSLGR
jgi:hypothetical protein